MTLTAAVQEARSLHSPVGAHQVATLTAVAIVTNVLGCGIPALLQRMSLRDSLTIGVAMIVALIGLSQGLIEQDTHAALILMSLLTTLIPPLVLRNWPFRNQPKTVKTTT